MTTTLLPIGTPVTILADTFGDDAATGTITGFVVYTHPETGAPQQGYAIHLDQGGYLDQLIDVPIGRRPWIGTIVAHVESVERLLPVLDEPEFSPAVESFLDDVMPGIEGQ